MERWQAGGLKESWGSRVGRVEVTIETEHAETNAHAHVMTVRLLTPFLVVVPAILFGLYQIRLKPLFEVAGVWREIQDVGRELKETCVSVDELKGCERKHRFQLSDPRLGLTVEISSPRLFRD